MTEPQTYALWFIQSHLFSFLDETTAKYVPLVMKTNIYVILSSYSWIEGNFNRLMFQVCNIVISLLFCSSELIAVSHNSFLAATLAIYCKMKTKPFHQPDVSTLSDRFFMQLSEILYYWRGYIKDPQRNFLMWYDAQYIFSSFSYSVFYYSYYIFWLIHHQLGKANQYLSLHIIDIYA